MWFSHRNFTQAGIPNRGETLYGGEDVKLEILDAVAVAESPLDLDAIRQRLGHPHREDLLEILKALRRDLYLVREDGKYRFRLAFLRRYWRLEREL